MPLSHLFHQLVPHHSPANPVSASPAKVSGKTKKVIATGGIKLPALGAAVKKPTTEDAPSQEEPIIVRLVLQGRLGHAQPFAL